jgi:hypothetical protein
VRLLAAGWLAAVLLLSGRRKRNLEIRAEGGTGEHITS